MAQQDGGWKQFFNAETARILGDTILRVYPEFDLDGFVSEVAMSVEGLELRDRVRVMTQALHKRLPGAYEEALKILVDSLGPELEPGQGMFTHGWYLMPVALFVEEYGLSHPELSLRALNEITRRHTAEYAIRPYLVRYPELTLRRLHEWAESDSFNVRRLVSEGVRPRLPWASKLDRFIQDPLPVLGLIEKLRDDPSNYVQKSVANNLNDISKDHPALVIEVAERWRRESPTPNTMWILRHGLRTLIKKGNPRALAILDIATNDRIALSNLQVTPERISMGDSVRFAFDLRNEDDQAHHISVDYVVHFVRANGQSNSKVFKITTCTLNAGESQHFVKNHSFKPTRVRRHYPGRHRISIQVNGRVLGEVDFDLRERVEA